MYQELPDNATKAQYEALLNETIDIFKNKVMQDDDELSKVILMQLMDIKEYIVDKRLLTDEDEIDERYNLGAIAIKNFEGDSDMESRLCDIFGGAIDYASMPENDNKTTIQ